MTRLKIVSLTIGLVFVLQPTKAYADFWGGDIPLLIQIVTNTLQELSKLETVIGKSQESLDLVREIHRGVREAMEIVRTQNDTLAPGVLSDLQDLQSILSKVEDVYGRIPKTPNSTLEQVTDTTVAEGIHLHNEAFRYANQVDPEAERIKEYAKNVNQLGAQKLTAQSVGVLIHVMTQILRTNATIVKLQSEQLALQNRTGKLGSEQLKFEYESLGEMYDSLKPTYQLNSLSQ